MNKNVKRTIVAAILTVISFTGLVSGAMALDHHNMVEMERTTLLQFIEYCRETEGLQQVDPHKDYTNSSLHVLKCIAKFYATQDNFADVTDYPEMELVDDILSIKVAGRTNN